MVIECDICGYKTPGQPNFCNGCGVDLREIKEIGSECVIENPLKNKKKSAKSIAPNEEKKYRIDNVISELLL